MHFQFTFAPMKATQHVKEKRKEREGGGSLLSFHKLTLSLPGFPAFEFEFS